jgi:2,5-furandicarboxylate decarboxylase 1
MRAMNPPAREPGTAIDYDRFRLRNYLESLAGSDELEIRDDAVDLADVGDALEGNPKAVWFRKVGPEGAELVGNVVASRGRLAKAFGVSQQELLPELLRRLDLAPELIDVSRDEAPVQQVVQTGAEIDLTALPIHLQHGLDGGLYISASIDYTVDNKTGWTNVGMRRLMVRGRDTTGIDAVSPSDLRAIYEAAVKRGENLPISFVVGAHPIDLVASSMRLPVDELGLISSLRAAPLAVVKGITNDIRVPADAECVIEGYLDSRGYVEAEGPYGEFLGYYGGVKQNPLFHCTAITRRRDALFQTASISGRAMSCTDTAMLNALKSESLVWRALETAIREPVAVYATPASGGLFNVRIAMRQRVPGEARNAIHAVFGSLANVKNVFIVDPDIDIYSDQQIDWALATRFQADRDLIVQGGLRALPLDPSLQGGRIGAKAGFDLTWAFGSGGRLEQTVPEPPRYDGPRFATIRAALENGPKHFAELMAATGSRDGREIIRGLETLAGERGITRDDRGRYVIGG